MIISINILLSITLFSSFYILKVVAFYGDPAHQITIPSTYGSSAITVNDKIYLIGGGRYLANTSTIPNSDVSIMTFSSNGTLQLQTITPKNPPRSCNPCAGFALPDGKTLVFLNVAYPAYNMTGDDNSTDVIYPGGLGFYHTSNNSWTFGRSPQYSDVVSLLRVDYSSAISSDKKFAYMGWGAMLFNNTYDFSKKILKYEISNTSNIQSIETDVAISAGCSVTLPSGVMIVAFGNNLEVELLYNTTQVMMFDTNTDKFTWKQVKADKASGTFPVGRVYASCTLGPDNSTIYYYGGSDATIDIHGIQNQYNMTVYNDIAMLDTNNWNWVLPKNIAGLKPLPASQTSMALFDSNKLLITTGLQGTTATGSVAVLNNIPLSNPSDEEANKLQWFTNDPKFDNVIENYGLSNGAIAGIIIAALVFTAILLVALWIFVPATKKIAAYIQQDLIWNPRSGEPLWAETSRLLVRFILLFLFLAFIAYVIWKSVNSATVSQHTSTSVDSVLAPDIRFCFDGFDQSNASVSPFVTCYFRNGTNCSGSIRPLNLTTQSPVYTDKFGDISCFLFLPGPSYYIHSDKGYSDSEGTKMMFNFFAQNTTADISRGVIYIDFYPPDYDPNTEVYGLGESKLSDDQIDDWVISEQANNVVDTIILKQTVRSTASYTLTTVKTLKPNDGWNYIGFSSNYDEYVRISSSFKEVPQNPELMPLTFYSTPIAQLTVQPSAFTENSDVDQRVFTLLNAFAQAGGVLGLFVAVQTVLFGFRPQSPWGIVHRWSFGKLRIKLTDRLANYFDRMGTPVPLVNPVSNRLSNINGQSYFKNTDNTYVPLGADTPSANDVNDINDHENRVHRVEERLQLMELLLKSYYLNDEVFRSLDQAVKRGNEEKRRSVFMSSSDKDTDSVLNNNALVIEDLIANTTKNQVGRDYATDLTRRPSSTVFPQQKDSYQPGLPPNPTEILYDEEQGILPGKK